MQLGKMFNSQMHQNVNQIIEEDSFNSSDYSDPS